MPVGVPKVPFRCPGEENASWVDNRLYRQRVLFLVQEVEDEISNQIVGLMVYLAIENPTRDQHLLINSPGGFIIPGLAIFDAMQFVPAAVHTLGIGIAASMASFILCGGEVTKRIAVMLHQPGSKLPLNNFLLEAEELHTLRNNLAEVYVERTKQPLRVIIEDLNRDSFMSATEAKAYGIVDLIAGEDVVINILTGDDFGTSDHRITSRRLLEGDYPVAGGDLVAGD
uniref:ATP-dependent Clp protease proteolytic subunit n=2 Tax=Calotropis TaxID=4065 RepID=A0A482EBF1_CALGI|nr:ClpP [Calotropis gigantea]YP_009574103.1 ClpP [Calotropis procera]QBM31295.1 ClpP [Calotropis gigantea]QBM31383.1 ClpP [Calotropis procera]